MKLTLSYLWKLPLCGIVFFLGMLLSAMLLPALGFSTPKMPAGADANTIVFYFLLASLLLAFVLSFVSQSLGANWMVRWVILAELSWNFGATGMVTESYFFMNTGAVSSFINALYTLLNFLPPFLLLSALVAALFKPVTPLEPCLDCLRVYFSSRRQVLWAWRLTAALLAYPLVYFVFGLLVSPFIQPYYVNGQIELTLPTWEQMIPLQLARSCLFPMVSLPVVAWWRGSRKELWLKLGLSIFVLTAFMAVITSYWFPWQLRLFHGLELLAGSLVYAGVLAALLWVAARQPTSSPEKRRSNDGEPGFVQLLTGSIQV